MKLVTQTDVVATRFSDEIAVRKICEADFDGIDYSLFAMKHDDNILNSSSYLPHVRNLRKIADGYGKTFEQSHAPFPSYKVNNVDNYNEKTFDRIKRSLEISAELGVKICVVHPSAIGEGQFEFNIDYYNKLAPFAKEYGVKIALENMWGSAEVDGKRKIVPNICSVAEDFNRYVDALDPELFTACLDLGHCGLVGDDAAKMLREMGNKRVTALHIHDNDFKNDTHTIPYLCDMDWDSILRALGEIDYKGNFTYEADRFLDEFPLELISNCYDFMAKIGRYMISEIEKYRVKV